MGLETGNLISDLVSSNPVSPDDEGEGDDHIRLIKTVLKEDAAAKSAINTFTDGQIFAGDVRIDGTLSVSAVVITGQGLRTFTDITVLKTATFSAITVTGPASFSSVFISNVFKINGGLTLSALTVNSSITTSSLAVLANAVFGGNIVANTGSFSAITVNGTIPSFVIARAQFRVTISETLAGKSDNITSLTHLQTGIFRINAPADTFSATDAVIGSAKKTFNDVTETCATVHPGTITGTQVNILVQRADQNQTGLDPEVCSIVVVR